MIVYSPDALQVISPALFQAEMVVDRRVPARGGIELRQYLLALAATNIIQ